MPAAWCPVKRKQNPVVNNIQAALLAATHQLDGATDTPRLDAELLMAHALQMERGRMLLDYHALSLPPEFADYLKRRIDGEPVAYIRGVQEFWDLSLTVTPDVLIPRSDSETLIEAALAFYDPSEAPTTILDLGTGSGALLLAALSLFPQAHGTGIDASLAALNIAQDNARDSGFEDRSIFHHKSWKEDSWANDLGRFDLILCNPPYVELTAQLDKSVREFEPSSALFSGEDGLDDYRILIPQIPQMLAKDGIAIFELGKGQVDDVQEIARLSGLKSHAHPDLAGIARALILSIDGG